MAKFTIADLEIVASGLDHPEGVACAFDGRLFAGGEAGQIYAVASESGTANQIATTGGFILGMALDADDNIYACDMARSVVAKITPTGEVSDYAKGDGQERINVPNYPVFDDEGNLYVSDSGGFEERNGRVWKVSPGGDAQVWTTQTAEFANGTAMSPDSTYLYVAESTLPGVSRIPINADGSAGQREVVVEMPNTVPDGLAFDVEGNLYISCFRPDRIYVFLTDGKLEILIDDGPAQSLNAPTNIAFGGADRQTLFIASLGGWVLHGLSMPIPGHRPHYPQI